jgi:hypothetical protein
VAYSRSVLLIYCVAAASCSVALAQNRLLDRLREEAAEELEEALLDRDEPAQPAPSVTPSRETSATPSMATPPTVAAASAWSSPGPWGAIGATSSAEGSVSLTFATGRAIVTQQPDGAYVGTWYGTGTTCAAPRDGAVSWGSVRLLAPTPTTVNLVLTECSNAGEGQPIAQFVGMIASGTSPFVTLGDFQSLGSAARAAPQPAVAGTAQPQLQTVPAIETAASPASAALPPDVIARMPPAAIEALPASITAAGGAQPPDNAAAPQTAGTNSAAAAPEHAGKLLASTDLVSAYALQPGPNQQCVAGAMLVFKVDERYEMLPDERYSAMLRDVLPAIMAHCPPLDGYGYSLTNYVDGYTNENPLGTFNVQIVDGVTNVEGPRGWWLYSIRARKISARL